MQSPVLFLIFNRPTSVEASLACLRAVRPPRLYIAADGPRPGREADAELCRLAREAAMRVDWPCEVKTLFRARNLGCARAVSSALAWFFQQETEGIVLEDDLVAHPDFFSFCDAMLERYRDAATVMHVSGNNFQFGLRRGTGSYYFSCFPHCWGWASWARAWRGYDFEMTGLAGFLEKKLPRLFTAPQTIDHWRHELMRTKAGLVDSWAYRWTYSIWRDKGLCILPNTNLVANAGFDGQGTHTVTRGIFEMLPTGPLNEIRHPDRLERDSDADNFTGRVHFSRYGSSLESLAQETVQRMEAEELDGARGLLNRAREFYGELPFLLQLDALISLREGNGKAALESAVALLERYPEYAADKNVMGLIRAAKP